MKDSDMLFLEISQNMSQFLNKKGNIVSLFSPQFCPSTQTSPGQNIKKQRQGGQAFYSKRHMN